MTGPSPSYPAILMPNSPGALKRTDYAQWVKNQS